jgi:23S rRNA (pseudouridine1915-N3)-methyltransferase
MRIVVLAVGRMRPPFDAASAHYLKLLSGQARVEVVEVRDEAALARRVPDRATVVALEAGGRLHGSEDFARWLEDRRHEGRDLVFAIGGAFGFGDGLPRVDHRLSLGPMTLPHLLARVVLLEQLFRAHKILAGEPYHH